MESGGRGKGKNNVKKMEAWEKRLNLRVRAKEFIRVTPLLITPSSSEVEEDGDVSKKKGAAAPAPAPAPAPAGAIRKGYFPVYVGEEKERFVIKTQLLNHPQFKVLLEEAELQYGYTNGGGGPLLLPCHVDTFHQLLAEMEKISTSSNATGGRPPRVQQMMNFTSTLSLGRSLICRFHGGNGQPSWLRRHYHNYTLLDRLKN